MSDFAECITVIFYKSWASKVLATDKINASVETLAISCCSSAPGAPIAQWVGASMDLRPLNQIFKLQSIDGRVQKCIRHL